MSGRKQKLMSLFTVLVVIFATMTINLELFVATYQSSTKKTETEFSRRKIVDLLKLHSKIRFKIIENNLPVPDQGSVACFVCSPHFVLFTNMPCMSSVPSVNVNFHL